METGGIVAERMMAGALRADGQRRMIGDTMTETKLPNRCSGATRELTQFTWPAPFRPPDSRCSDSWLIRTPFIYTNLPAVLMLVKTGGVSIIIKFRSTTIQCNS